MFGKKKKNEPENNIPQKPAGTGDDLSEQLRKLQEQADASLDAARSGLPGGADLDSNISLDGSDNSTGPMAPRASGTAKGITDRLTGSEYGRHIEARKAGTFNPTTEKEFNTDANLLAEEQGNQKIAVPNSQDWRDSKQRQQKILDAYKELGRKAIDKTNTTQNYPNTTNPKYKKAVDHLKDAYRQGYQERQGSGELPKEPSQTPAQTGTTVAGVRGSQTYSQDEPDFDKLDSQDSAKASDTSNQEYLTGSAYADHLESRKAGKFDPKNEKEFNTDARILAEEQFKQKIAPENSQDWKDSKAREKQLLDAYSNLGKNAIDKDDPTQNYPRTGNKKFKKDVDKLKEAFKQGYREKQK